MFGTVERTTLRSKKANSLTSIDNPGQGDCAFYAFAVGLMLIPDEQRTDKMKALFDGVNGALWQTLCQEIREVIPERINDEYKPLQQELRTLLKQSCIEELNSNSKSTSIFSKFQSANQIEEGNILSQSATVRNLAESASTFIKDTDETLKSVLTQAILKKYRADFEEILSRYETTNWWATDDEIEYLAKYFGVRCVIFGDRFSSVRNLNDIDLIKSVFIVNIGNAHYETILPNDAAFEIAANYKKTTTKTEESKTLGRLIQFDTLNRIFPDMQFPEAWENKPIDKSFVIAIDYMISECKNLKKYESQLQSDKLKPEERAILNDKLSLSQFIIEYYHNQFLQLMQQAEPPSQETLTDFRDRYILNREKFILKNGLAKFQITIHDAWLEQANQCLIGALKNLLDQHQHLSACQEKLSRVKSDSYYDSSLKYLCDWYQENIRRMQGLLSFVNNAQNPSEAQIKEILGNVQQREVDIAEDKLLEDFSRLHQEQLLKEQELSRLKQESLLKEKELLDKYYRQHQERLFNKTKPKDRELTFAECLAEQPFNIPDDGDELSETSEMNNNQHQHPQLKIWSGLVGAAVADLLVYAIPGAFDVLSKALTISSAPVLYIFIGVCFAFIGIVFENIIAPILSKVISDKNDDEDDRLFKFD